MIKTTLLVGAVAVAVTIHSFNSRILKKSFVLNTEYSLSSPHNSHHSFTIHIVLFTRLFVDHQEKASLQ